MGTFLRGRFQARAAKESWWKRLFSDRSLICDEFGAELALLNFQNRVQCMYQITIGDRILVVPTTRVGGLDHSGDWCSPLLEGDEEIAHVKCAARMADRTIDFGGQTYDHIDIPATLRKHQLKLGDRLLATADPPGWVGTWPKVEVLEELPMELIVLMFLVYRGVTRNVNSPS